jgi:hypothetical protein
VATEEVIANVQCPNCERDVMDVMLQPCPICRTLFCHLCTVRGYGRSFCCTRCRDLFFFGDGEEKAEDF